MSILSGVSDFFGLDIGTTAIRVVELKGSGNVKALVKYGYAPVDSRIAQSDSKGDQQKLMQITRELIAQAGITTQNVAVGLPSYRVFTTVVDMERLSPSETNKAIIYQAESLIPTPVVESKISWSLLGDSPKESSKVEVLLSSVANDFLEPRLDMLESIGLNVIAFEAESMALIRSVTAPEATEAQMVIDVGTKATDLVVVLNGAPRLIRAIPTGTEALVKAAVQNLNIDEKRAEQFVFKFGLSRDKLEGQIYNAILPTIEVLMSEIDKSIKFFQTRYINSKIMRVIVTGGVAALPEFPLYIANKFGLNVEIGNAWRNVAFPSNRQNELLAVANQFSVAVGLAERVE